MEKMLWFGDRFGKPGGFFFKVENFTATLSKSYKSSVDTGSFFFLIRENRHTAVKTINSPFQKISHIDCIIGTLETSPQSAALHLRGGWL